MCTPYKTSKLTTDFLDEFGRSSLSTALFDKLVDPSCYIDSIKEVEADDSDLIVMPLNIRSMVNKTKPLTNLLEETSVDVCLLNETWLSTHTKPLCNIDGYYLESVE